MGRFVKRGISLFLSLSLSLCFPPYPLSVTIFVCLFLLFSSSVLLLIHVINTTPSHMTNGSKDPQFISSVHQSR